MDDLQEQLEMHRRLAQAMPRAWNPFFARFGSLRPIQLMAIPQLLQGHNALITAPTAGGKTEAIVAPICERIAREGWTGLSAILITPTRALVNDLFCRLETPLNTMRISLGRKTADHAMTLDEVPQLLVTTPESTESLLTFRRDALRNLKAIIVDEIHLLDGTPRGDQLRLLIQRLVRYRQHVGGDGFIDVQRIAMSATVADPERLARGYLGPRAIVVSVPGQRKIESRILLCAGDDEQRARDIVTAFQSFDDVRKVLIFVNSRKQVDVLTKAFQTDSFARVPVYGHHGSLAKEERERTELRFKSDERAVCVATMTLEVGIDIGDIDLVVCIDPPFSLSSFLQRIGRGCRRLQGLTRVLCVARNRAGELMFEALLQQAAIGMPPGPLPPLRRSVLIQQTLAYLKQVDRHGRNIEQFNRVFVCSEKPAFTDERVGGVIADMSHSGLLDQVGPDAFRPASQGWDFIESNKIYSNMAPPRFEAEVVHADTGQVIATVAGRGSSDTGMRIAGNSYNILPGSSTERILVRPGGQHSDSPTYSTSFLPYGYDIGIALANRLRIAPDTLVGLEQAEGILLFTWLGRLFNSAISRTIQRHGQHAAGDAFFIRMSGALPVDLLGTVKNAIQEICDRNPLGEMRVERAVDMGPYFSMLSNDLQKLAREDWLDREFLHRWSAGKSLVVRTDITSELGRDLLAITRPRDRG